MMTKEANALSAPIVNAASYSGVGILRVRSRTAFEHSLTTSCCCPAENGPEFDALLGIKVNQWDGRPLPIRHRCARVEAPVNQSR